MNFKVGESLKGKKYSELFFLNLQITTHIKLPKMFKF
jgi:hypothetical protein